MMKRELTLQAVTENLDQVLAFVEENLEEWECPLKVLMQVQIAVEEIYVNIAKYAYKTEAGEATIRVEVKGEPRQVCITFVDQGVPYDPLAKEDPDAVSYTHLDVYKRQRLRSSLYRHFLM